MLEKLHEVVSDDAILARIGGDIGGHDAYPAADIDRDRMRAAASK